jgi:hypothetical protein
VSPVVHLSPASILILFAATASIFLYDSCFSVRSDLASLLASSGKANRALHFPRFQVIRLPPGSVLRVFLVSRWWSSVFIPGSRGSDCRPDFPLPLLQLPLSAGRSAEFVARTQSRRTVRSRLSGPRSLLAEHFGPVLKPALPA